jgi:hypothetical protein
VIISAIEWLNSFIRVNTSANKYQYQLSSFAFSSLIVYLNGSRKFNYSFIPLRMYKWNVCINAVLTYSSILSVRRYSVNTISSVVLHEYLKIWRNFKLYYLHKTTY